MLCAAALDDDRGVLGQRRRGWRLMEGLIKTAVIDSSYHVCCRGVHMMGVPRCRRGEEELGNHLDMRMVEGDRATRLTDPPCRPLTACHRPTADCIKIVILSVILTPLSHPPLNSLSLSLI